jgi:hypothetical protein
LMNSIPELHNPYHCSQLVVKLAIFRTYPIETCYLESGKLHLLYENE